MAAYYGNRLQQRAINMRKFGLSTVVTLVAFVPALSAHAANTQAEERAARKACLSGNVQKGVEILSELFVKTEDATLIYNQGRCFEQNGRHKEAINRFREYLRKAHNISARVKADTEKHIADCRALLGEDAETETAAKPKLGPKPEPVPPPKPEPVREVPTKAKDEETVPQPTTPPPPTQKAELPLRPPVPPEVEAPEGSKPLVVTPTEPATNPGRGLRIAGLTCGVVGVASLATGIYFYTRARSYSDKVSDQDVPNPSDDSAGKTAETMQWVFYGVGGAALATGAVLYTLGWQSGSGSTTAIAPLFGNGVAGISAQGAF
jgi:hypothetical protein